MGQAFINSFVVTVPATIIPILIAAFAAYAFTFMEWRGRDIVFIIIVGLLVVPNQVALVPLLKLYGAVGLNGTFPAVWLAHIGFGMPLAIYILRNYMSTLPLAIIESAKIDGASHFTTFWRLIMPMSVPALASFAIFQFLWVWNDLLVALLFLGRGDNTILTVALQGLQGQTGAGPRAHPLRRIRHHLRPTDRLPVAAAVLHPRHDGGSGQGLTTRSSSTRYAASRSGRGIPLCVRVSAELGRALGCRRRPWRP